MRTFPILAAGIGIFLFLCTSAFAAEQITITTYYPSPYGSYYDLYIANNVGIGTSSPSGKLEVRAGASESTDPLVIGKGSNTYVFVRNSDGNVGIGVTNPAYKLEVSGDVRATGVFRSSDGSSGITQTLTVRDSGGAADCNIVIKNGLVTGSSC